MLRRALVAASTSSTLRRIATDVPITRSVAQRFVAGETLEDALAATRRINARGMSVTLDYLGESVTDESVARDAADVYLDAIDRISAEGLDCSLSLKPTQLGFDAMPWLADELIATICEKAASIGTHVTIDMEGSAYTQATVEMVERLRKDGHDNVGCAVQSYLHRTVDDVRRLTSLGASLRICKGAYAEPVDIAYQEAAEVDDNYLRAVDVVLKGDTFGRFATHDHRIIARVRNLAARYQVSASRFEFQMLFGVREPLQQQLVEDGFNMRIYVPFGDEWYPYLTRRLAERPANLLFFLRALTGKRI